MFQGILSISKKLFRGGIRVDLPPSCSDEFPTLTGFFLWWLPLGASIRKLLRFFKKIIFENVEFFDFFENFEFFEIFEILEFFEIFEFFDDDDVDDDDSL